MVVASVALTPEQQQQEKFPEQQEEANITKRRLSTVAELVAQDLFENDQIETRSESTNKLECRLYQRTGRVRQLLPNDATTTCAQPSLHPLHLS